MSSGEAPQEQRHVLEKKDSNEKMLPEEAPNSREMSQQEVLASKQIDLSLLEIYEAVSFNVFRFVFNNVTIYDPALRLSILSDDIFPYRRAAIRQDGAEQSTG